MNSFPDEILFKVFTEFSVKDLKIACFVCNRWYNIISDPSLWERVIRKICKVQYDGMLEDENTPKSMVEWIKLYDIVSVLPERFYHDLKLFITFSNWRKLKADEITQRVLRMRLIYHGVLDLSIEEKLN